MPVTVDTTGQPEAAKAYHRLAKRNPQNGKGDAPRNCFSASYRRNYDRIFRRTEQRSFKQRKIIL